MSIEFVTAPDGSRKVVMSEADFQDLFDARDHAEAMRRVAAGAPTFAEAEVDAYLVARSPLAFWRQRAGLTQKALADKVGVSQAYLAQLEASEREGGVGVWAQLADALGIRVDDLINDAPSVPEKLAEQEQDRRRSVRKP
jgi:DNA-binding XRE family transcriptional regulator